MTFNDYKAYRETLKPLLEQKKLLHSNSPEITGESSDNNNTWYLTAFMVFIAIAIFLAFCVFPGCAQASQVNIIEGYNINTWAEAIHHAEGNDNYGILQHYKHTTYKQACINTIRHKYRDWLNMGHPGEFLGYLASKYCPVGCDNDNGTNKYWENNVRFWLNRLGGK